MDNYQIADTFSLLAKLMDIHGENSFKTKSYSNAAFQIEKLQVQLATMDDANIAVQRGVGSAIAQKIREIIDTGKLSLLEKYIQNTPAGVVEMLNIKGLGPKKINTIWKEMGIESIGELQYACNENRLTLFKGFGEKTQANVNEAISFYLSQQGLFLYQQVESLVTECIQFLQQQIVSGKQVVATGAYRRQAEIVEEIELLTDAEPAEIAASLKSLEHFSPLQNEPQKLIYQITSGPILTIHFSHPHSFAMDMIATTGSSEFAEAVITQVDKSKTFSSEEEIFASIGLPFIPACLRENASVITQIRSNGIPALIQPTDIKGIIHTHSTWSDGSETIETMARHAMAMGFEYLVISDHSKSATYANGLSEERIKMQHAEIDKLNTQLAPFKIFKSIESDILGDGSLDYSDNILSTFDLVIASVHSNLKMTEEKAMQRLLAAISNPYVTILGHMTGRLLISRKGYPVQHEKIIDACVQHHVAIELNAHPRRLDMDWRYIQQAVNAGALISIDPDAHALDGFADTRYGVLAAQKGMLTASKNLSSMSLEQFENYLQQTKTAKGLG
jgi:DNA polymerase (family X)